jgi:putative sterol carrier protein
VSSELDNFFTALPEQAAGKDLSGVRGTYVFEVEGGDAWTVRVEGGKVAVSAGSDASADCTISATEETFSKLIKRELGALPAYLSGKLKLSGDLAAAMQLQKLIS